MPDLNPNFVRQIRADEPATFAPGKTLNEAAQANVVALLESLLAGDIDAASDVYSWQETAGEKFMLAGGGPTVWLHIVDGDGFLTWNEGGESGVAMVPDYFVEDLRQALR